jgi:hypothetical protein
MKTEKRKMGSLLEFEGRILKCVPRKESSCNGCYLCEEHNDRDAKCDLLGDCTKMIFKQVKTIKID